jgi:cytoskeletal protein RodZ
MSFGKCKRQQEHTMSNLITRSTLVASALATVLIGAIAQTPAPTTPPDTAPATVGTSPATAATATDKAVPRADVGTVVRTGPSATDKLAPDSTAPARTDATMGTDTTMPPPKTDRN